MFVEGQYKYNNIHLSIYDDLEGRQTSKLQNRIFLLFDVELYLTVHKSFLS
jgi:hypothetical protein